MNSGLYGFSNPAVFVPPYVNIQDQKASGTDGGTFTSGADQTRTLNTVDSDGGGVATLASNQITLQPGIYTYHITAPAQGCNRHQAFLYNVTDAVVVKRGTSEIANSAASAQTCSIIRGKMVLTVAKVLEVRHRAETTKATNGFGVGANFGTEVYTVAEFWKLA